MIQEIVQTTGRFIFTLLLSTIATVHTLIIAVPDANRPGAIAASITAALIIAMYDLGVFHVDTENLSIH